MTATAPLAAPVLEGLKRLFGDRVSTAAAVREQHGKDESYHEPHAPDAVVFAHSAEEVAEAVKLCAAHKVPVIPFGTGHIPGKAALPRFEVVSASTYRR